MFTNLNLKELTIERARSHTSVAVAIVGAGWFGRGLVYELRQWPGIEPRVLFDRTEQKAVDALLRAGYSRNEIGVVHTSAELSRAVKQGKHVVSSKMDLIKELPDTIDVFFDATGNILAGAEFARDIFAQKIHFLTISAEMDATVGYALNRLARKAGVLFSNCDGDQPGVLARMITEVNLMGFDIVVAGNGKGFLDYYATPESIQAFVREGDSPRKIASFTDGSKQAMELTVLANGMGLVPDCRGMHGVKTTKEDLVRDVTSCLSKENVVEYVMGRDGYMGMTVFVIGKRRDEQVQPDLEYLRMGPGPEYLFFRDNHLCYFEAPKSIAEMVLFNKPTICPLDLKADVVSVAKKDLKKGERLDGVGGFTVYGLIDEYGTVLGENGLPLGLSEFAVLTRDIKKDTVISYDMVDFPENNLALDLRRRQDEEFKSR